MIPLYFTFFLALSVMLPLLALWPTTEEKSLKCIYYLLQHWIKMNFTFLNHFFLSMFLSFIKSFQRVGYDLLRFLSALHEKCPFFIRLMVKGKTIASNTYAIVVTWLDIKVINKKNRRNWLCHTVDNRDSHRTTLFLLINRVRRYPAK